MHPLHQQRIFQLAVETRRTDNIYDIPEIVIPYQSGIPYLVSIALVV